MFIVRKVLGEVRKAACREEECQLEKVLRRTRVVVLGKRTEGRREGELWTKCLSTLYSSTLKSCPMNKKRPKKATG